MEKFQLSILNLNNLWNFIEVFAVFVSNLCGEKSVRRKSLWRKNDKYEACLILADNMSEPIYPLIPLTTSNIWEKVDGDVLGKGSVPMSLNYPIIVISGTRDHSH